MANISIKTKFGIGDVVWCLDWYKSPYLVGKIRVIRIYKKNGKITHDYLAGESDNPFKESVLRKNKNGWK